MPRGIEGPDELRILVAKAVHDPVVKSCSRQPTAMITSAFSAIALALSEPVTPTGPMLSGCPPAGWPDRRWFRSQESVGLGESGQFLAPRAEYCTPPPAMITGRCADFRAPPRHRQSHLVRVPGGGCGGFFAKNATG
jgi:hypothetical protein